MADIDRDFWFDLGRASITSALERLDKAADRLATVLLWYWGAYTAVITLGISFEKLAYSPLMVIILLAPVPVIMVAYWAATLAQMPVMEGFHPASAPTIMESYAKGVDKRKRRLRNAHLSALVSAVLVATALCVASTASNRATYDFHAQSIPTNVGSKVSITGDFPAWARITIRLCPGPTLQGGATAVFFERMPFIATASGTVQASFPVPFDASDAEVAVTWEEAGKTRGLIRRVGE